MTLKSSRMKNFVLVVVVLMTVMLFINCSKTPPEPTLKTRLLITLRDDEGKSVDSAIVKLFKNGTTTAITKMVDSTGIAYFPDLETVTYHWTAEKGCKTNLASQQTLNKPLVEGGILYGYSVLSSRAVLKIQNTSADKYKLTDSTINVSLAADTTLYVYPKIGNRTFHFVPVDTLKKAKDTVLKIRCGDTAFLKLPF
jgi:hypothetical protein